MNQNGETTNEAKPKRRVRKAGIVHVQYKLTGEPGRRLRAYSEKQYLNAAAAARKLMLERLDQVEASAEAA
jgi:hypothetical protein